MTNSCEKLVKLTNKEADWSADERKRNFVKNEVQRSKRNYYQTKLRENSSKQDRL